MKPLHLNPELIARIDEAERAFFGDLSRVTNECQGSDVCKLITKPGLIAFCSPAVSDPLLNRILVSNACEASELCSLIDENFKTDSGTHIEISPGSLTHELSMELYSRGYAHTDFLPILVNYADRVLQEEPKLRVKRVDTEAELSKFKELIVAGWTVPPAELPETLGSTVEKWNQLPGWTLLLAYDGDEAVSCGILHCYKGVGFLAVSATPPQFRGRGGQSAIDRARINAAVKEKVELVWSRTYFASASQRNKEKVNLNVLYLRAGWSKVK